MQDKIKQSARKTLSSLLAMLPIIMGMLLLTSLIVELFPEQIASGLFGKNSVVDAWVGATIGGIAAGHPLVSYILGGELLSSGVSLFAVTALIVSWVTVGIVQLPAEALMLGKCFAIYRNLICYLFAIVIALLTVFTLQLMG
ncbi:MAG: hypothetical protein LJE83_13220 [Gammaproteobacteria bacterium]|nr:hypothetical protein [Gammaproteobacteria bacterium]